MSAFHGWKIEVTEANGRKRATATKKNNGTIFTEGLATINEEILVERLQDEVLAQEVRNADGKENFAKFTKLRDEHNLTKRINNRTRGIERAMREGMTPEDVAEATFVTSE